MREEITSPAIEIIEGKVSSYNSNTFKGRIYVLTEGRSVPFKLDIGCRSDLVVGLVVSSLGVNAVRNTNSEWSTIYCRVLRITTRNGTLKSYKIFEISNTPFTG